MDKLLLGIWLGTLCIASPTLANILCLTGDFDNQVATLFDYIKLSDERLRGLSQAMSDVERVLQPRWPGCKVMAYGSTVTGLALKSSDIDCYVDVPGNSENPQVLVAEALQILKNYPNLFQNFELTPTARVPVVTCVHVPTSVFMDLTFSGPFAVNSSLMLSQLLHMDQRALDLATIIKYWGSIHDIANGKQTLPSYAIVLMTIFYLQQKGIVPSVAKLQENITAYELDNWNTAFAPVEHHTNNNDTLYELLGGFFKYYSKFDFENTVISPYAGYPIKRGHFEELDKLANFHTYKRNLKNGSVRPYPFGYLNVQDTFRHSDNTARPNAQRWLAIRLMKHVRAAARMFRVLPSEEFLTAVLVPEKRIEAGVLKTFWSGGIGAPEDCSITFDETTR